MYKLLIWLLLAFVPLTGVRMVCIAKAPAPVASAGATNEDCDQFCLRSNAPKPEARSGKVECMLLAECSLLVGVSTVAVLPDQTPITYDLTLRHRTFEVFDSYLAPNLAHHTPPPKA